MMSFRGSSSVCKVKLKQGAFHLRAWPGTKDTKTPSLNLLNNILAVFIIFLQWLRNCLNYQAINGQGLTSQPDLNRSQSPQLRSQTRSACSFLLERGAPGGVMALQLCSKWRRNCEETSSAIGM
ncbi:hypothetical protein I7I50_11346 [Histoplasma capsulatum G186AR]|uniref:Uncharacterized protein n=1 Tax=Ajellomyces capsulatus TaxID=5037 RepID=A0A8H7ZAP2_AJECA|nr:hypothetical protein I7I52_02584 [Histoplasma capsulatum]QSS69903.1 hypothetical protein I7I50_11346 [Histoplasma capsulatum G186AR]